MDKDLNFVSRYRAGRKRFTRASYPRVVFAENASAKVLESTSTTAKEITA